MVQLQPRQITVCLQESVKDKNCLVNPSLYKCKSCKTKELESAKTLRGEQTGPHAWTHLERFQQQSRGEKGRKS